MADGLPVEGVDYAFGKHPSPAALTAVGKKFVVRYGGPGTSDKWIHADEARALAAAGIWIVANAEGSTAGLTGGFAAGKAWATSALAWFRSIGMPKGRPVYLSVDFDCNALQWATVREAFKGAASVLGLENTGVYGGRRAIEWARRDDVARWFWQTYAWSGGVWVPGNHLEQYHNGVYIDGADCDLDRAMQADYGQWMPGVLPSKPTSKGGEDMFLYKLKGDPAVYERWGDCRHHVESTGRFNAMVAGGAVLIEVATEAELLDAVGPEPSAAPGAPSGDLVEVVRKVVREELNKTHLTD